MYVVYGNFLDINVFNKEYKNVFQHNNKQHFKDAAVLGIIRAKKVFGIEHDIHKSQKMLYDFLPNNIIWKKIFTHRIHIQVLFIVTEIYI